MSKTDDELFQEMYASFEVPDIKEFDVKGFINYCESVYKMSNEEFLKHFKDVNYEGNVDMQLWYHHGKEDIK